MKKRSLCFGVIVSVILCFPIVVQVLRAQSQFQQFRSSNGPFSGNAFTLAAMQNAVFVGVASPKSEQGGLYAAALNTTNAIVTGQQTSWVRLSGLPEPTNLAQCRSFGKSLLALMNTGAGGGRLFYSEDNGITWKSVGGTIQGFTHIVQTSFPQTSAADKDNDTLLARTGIGTNTPTIFVRSTDAGKTWSAIQQARNSINSIVAFYPKLSPNSSVIFGGSNGLGLFRSVNNGSNWTQVTLPPSSQTIIVNALVSTTDDNLLLATNLGVFASNDQGLTWVSQNKGLEGKAVTTLVTQSGLVLAGTSEGCFQYKNSQWEQIFINGLASNEAVSELSIVQNSFIYAATSRGFFRSNNINESPALHWEQVNTGLPSISVEAQTLSSRGNTAFVATSAEGIFRSDSGVTWLSANAGIALPLTTSTTPRLWVASTNAVVATRLNSFTLNTNNSSEIWKASEQGISNEEVTSFGSSLSSQGEILYAGTRNGVIFRSINGGRDWTRVQTDFAASINSIHSFGQTQTQSSSMLRLFAGTSSGIAESNDGGNTWKLIGEPRFPTLLNVFSICSSWENGVLLASTPRGIYRSTTSGETWVYLANTATLGSVQSLAELQGVFYAGTATQGVFRSADNGRNWVKISDLESGFSQVNMLSLTNSKLLVGTPNGIFTTDVPPPSSASPIITSMSTDTAIVGSPDKTITIRGRNFASLAQIDFGGQSVQQDLVRVISATEIRCTLPARFLTNIGDVILSVINPATANFPSQRASAQFSIVDVVGTLPIIFAVEPDSVFINELSTITIIGRNLGGTTVQLSGEILAQQSASATRLILTIPTRLASTLGTRTFTIQNITTNERATASFRVVLPPERPVQLTVSPTSFQPFTTFRTVPSLQQALTLSAESVENWLVLKVENGFQLSVNANDWADSIAIPARTVGTSSGLISSTTVAVRFFPQATSPQNDSTTGIISVFSSRGTLLQQIPVRGIISQLSLQIAPTNTLNFGLMRVGTATQATVRLTNPTPLSLTLTVLVTNAQMATNSAFTASVRQISLAPNESQILTVAFAPTRKGLETARLLVAGAASASLNLVGEGGQAEFVLSRQSIEFSTTAYLRQKAQFPIEQVLVRNVGNIDDVLLGVSFQTAGLFSLQNFQQTRLAPGSSLPLTIRFSADSISGEETIGNSTRQVESRLALVSLFSATAPAITLRGNIKVLQPPILRSPNPSQATFISTDRVQLEWQDVTDATSYQTALTNSIANIFTSLPLTTTTTSTNVSVVKNSSYHWTVRSVRVDAASGDTIAVSSWQDIAFFHTLTSPLPALTNVQGIEFGEVALQMSPLPRIERRRTLKIPVADTELRVQNISFINNSQTSDDFSITPFDRQTLTFAPLSSTSPTTTTLFPLPIIFSPKVEKSYKGRIVLGLQDAAMRRFEWSIGLTGAGAVCRNTAQIQPCPETRLALSIVPLQPRNTSSSSATFLAGEEVRLQIRLVSMNAAAQAMEKFLRRIRMDISLQGSSLIQFRQQLAIGIPVKGRENSAIVLRSQPRRTNAGIERQQGMIELEVERPQGVMRDFILAEIPAVCTVGLRGNTSSLGTSRIDALDSLKFSFTSDPIWLDDNDNVLSNIEISGATDTAKAIVNTCPDGNLSSFLTVTQAVQIQAIAPNPVIGKSSVVFALRDEGQITLELINMLGQPVLTMVSGKLNEGVYNTDFSTDNLPAGTYFLRLRTPFETIQRRLEVVK